MAKQWITNSADLQIISNVHCAFALYGHFAVGERKKNTLRMKKHVHFVIDKLFCQPFSKPNLEPILVASKSRFFRFIAKYFFIFAAAAAQRIVTNLLLQLTSHG
jgi:hypothetical protein